MNYWYCPKKKGETKVPLNPVYVEANDLSDAFFQTIYKILEVGREFIIDRGSFAGQKRLEFDYYTCRIKHPGTLPLLPKINPLLGLPDPVAEGYLDEYLPYLMTGAEKPGESYTYGSRICNAPFQLLEQIGDSSRIMIKEREVFSDKKIVTSKYDQTNHGADWFGDPHFLNQMELMIWTYKNKGHRNNQMVLQIAQPSDMLLQDPPCLREIDTRIQDNQLHFFPRFRCIDVDTLMVYKTNNLVHIGPIGEIHGLVSLGKKVQIINTDLKTGKIRWSNIKQSSIRKADNIRRYDFTSVMSFGMTDEHIVFDENLKEKSAGDLSVFDNLIKVQLLTTLPRQRIKEVNLCEMFQDDDDVYLYNWESTKQLKDLFEYNLPEKWDLYRDGKYIPITELESIDNIPENVTIGIKLCTNKYKPELKLTFEFGYLVGQYLANGWIKSDNHILIAVGESQ